MKKIIIFACLLMQVMMVAAENQYKIGVCDWMILKRQKTGAFIWAKRLCADGIELDMGSLGKRDSFENKLRNEAELAKFIQMSDSMKVSVGAVAMSGLYAQSFIQKKSYKWLIEDCLNTMDKLGGVKVAFLPLGGCGNDWTTDSKKYKAVVKRLREVGKMAAKRGKVLGIDTPLDADGNLKLLKDIKSTGIKIFYKFQTAIENNVDICADMKKLGKENICAIHASNTDGVWIRNDKALDMVAIRQTLTEMGWTGWMFVERSRDVKQVKNVAANYGDNVNYLKNVFAEERFPLTDTSKMDSGYVQTIMKRAQKVTDALHMTGTGQGENVRNLVANHYFELNNIYTKRDSIAKTDKAQAEQYVNAALYKKHFDFDANLGSILTPMEIETVKDVITYNVVKVKYDAQIDMIPSLNMEERAQLLTWLKEAREYAIDAEGSKQKHALFKKYMGRFSNWLSKRGYDIQKERKDWGARVKAKGGKL